MNCEIIYAKEELIPEFYATLGAVASERIYIETLEPPPLEEIYKFQREMIAKNLPAYYVVENKKVVGWADISPFSRPRLAHRGSLGMGLLPSHRGQGLGAKVLLAALEHAKRIGLEKVELTVYTENLPAIALYKKLSFEQEGLIKHYRKLDGRYFDCIAMGKFL